MRRAFRTVFLLVLLLTAFFVVAGAGYVHVRAQDDVAKPREDLFADLPEDGLITGKVPEGTAKVAVLLAANPDSDEDSPVADLRGADVYHAEGLRLILEQQLQYMPQLVTENAHERVVRFGARLRHEGVPHAGDKDIDGRKHARLDEGLKTFNADVLLVLSFRAGDPATGLVYRYSSAAGVHASRQWSFGPLGKPEADSVTRQLEEIAAALCAGIGVEAEHAPIPPLVTSDKALRAFARMTLAYSSGNATEAWVEYEKLKDIDPRAGRSAHYAMEMFLALSQEQSDPATKHEYMLKILRAGRDALRHVPNDTHIRGRLGWFGAMHFGRIDFGRKALEQALKVQPANRDEIERYLTVYEIESVEKQVEWLKAYALPKIKTGWAERTIALTYFTRGNYASGVEWYAKALKIAPGDFETQLSAGLCGYYEARRLAKQLKTEEADEVFATATEALRTALRIDPQEVPYLYDYYVRAATHDYSWLPMNPQELEELFMVQSVLTGLNSSSRTFQWDRLVKDIQPAQKRLVKAAAKEAKPDDELYALKLLTRLRLAYNDGEQEDVVHTLWLLKEAGYRPEVYEAYMHTFRAAVSEYQPPATQPEDE